MCCNFLFFFFKQKTAYEMRISDWSSDVCSSDLDLTSKDKSKSAIAAGSVEFASNDSVEAAATNRSAEPEVIPVDPDGTEELPAATIEDGSEGEVQGRSGAMLKSGQIGRAHV